MSVPPVARGVICVDFDGTLFPWGPLDSEDPPFPGAVKFVRAAKDTGYQIIIFTSRLSHTWHRHEIQREPGEGYLNWLIRVVDFSTEQREHVIKTLKKHKIPFDELTAEKIPAEVYLDDRAVHFDGDWLRAAADMSAIQNKLSPTDVAWAAGFFDGEGSIGIYAYSRPNNGGGAHGTLSIAVSQMDRRPLLKLQEMFGGSLYLNKAHLPRPIWQWKINPAAALLFLSLVEPRLLVKREQALLAIEFTGLLNKQGDWSKVSDDKINRRHEIIEELKRLKTAFAEK